MEHDTTVLLVDDHSVMREGLRSLLEAQGGFHVIGEARTGREAVEKVKTLAPDVVVMDVRMPELNGFDAARQAIGAKPGLKVIALSGLNDDASAVGMLKAGAVGYVTKDCAFDELVIAIRTAISNKVYFSPEVIARAAAHTESDNSKSAFSELSPREREVLQLISEGKATKNIAIELNVSVKTAETHRRNIMEKLGIDSVAELTKYAIREGLTGV
ncbi:MAG TPA: response regulator transcription factor [Tepidisphaeraceae bacterium]|nr:response regulator transcription factor [Tepidisphaeraceae bacterium]